MHNRNFHFFDRDYLFRCSNLETKRSAYDGENHGHAFAYLLTSLKKIRTDRKPSTDLAKSLLPSTSKIRRLGGECG